MAPTALLDTLEEGLRAQGYLKAPEQSLTAPASVLRALEPSEETTSRWIRSSREEVERSLARTAHQSAQAADLGRKLRLVLAMMDEVPFATAARLVSVPETRLTAWLHGREPVRPAAAKRLDALAVILGSLHQVLEPSATHDWLRTRIPALGGMTPIEAVLAGKIGRVVKVARSYVDPSYS